MQNSENLQGIYKHLGISSDFRGSKLKIFPGSIPPDPCSLFTFRKWRTIILLHHWLSCLISGSIFLGHFLWKIWESSNENSATLRGESSNENSAFPRFQKIYRNYFFVGSKCRMKDVLGKGRQISSASPKKIYATTLLLVGQTIRKFAVIT